MSILEKHLAFVNEQIAVQQKLAARFTAEPKRQKLHLDSADKFKALAAALEEAEKALNGVPAASRIRPLQLRLSLTQEDVEGLPEELVKELSISDADRTEFAILNLVDESGG